MANSIRWLDIVKHRLRTFRAPYLLVIQHHDVPSETRISAPVTLPLPGDVDVLAPRVTLDGVEYRVRLLDMAAVPKGVLSNAVGSAANDADAIMGALDVVLHGYPVGRPG